MNKTEFSKLADIIRTYYPHANIMPNEQALSLWYEELKQLSFEMALASVRYHVNTSNRIVTIYDIKNALADTNETWELGYEKVKIAISQYGYYEPKKALDSFDDVTLAAVKSIGWNNICTSETPDIIRGQFRDAYNNAKERKLKKEIIENTTTGIAAFIGNNSNMLSYKADSDPERK